MGFCEVARQDFSPLGPGNEPPPGVNGAEIYAPPPPPDLRPEPQPELGPRPDSDPENGASLEYEEPAMESANNQDPPANMAVDSEQCRVSSYFIKTRRATGKIRLFSCSLTKRNK